MYVEELTTDQSTGYEMSLLILASIYQIDICVVHPEYLWINNPATPVEQCLVIMLFNNQGYFVGTVPKKKKLPTVELSEDTDKMIQALEADKEAINNKKLVKEQAEMLKNFEDMKKANKACEKKEKAAAKKKTTASKRTTRSASSKEKKTIDTPKITPKTVELDLSLEIDPVKKETPTSGTQRTQSTPSSAAASSSPVTPSGRAVPISDATQSSAAQGGSTATPSSGRPRASGSTPSGAAGSSAATPASGAARTYPATPSSSGSRTSAKSSKRKRPETNSESSDESSENDENKKIAHSTPRKRVLRQGNNRSFKDHTVVGDKDIEKLSPITRTQEAVRKKEYELRTRTKIGSMKEESSDGMDITLDDDPSYVVSKDDADTSLNSSKQLEDSIEYQKESVTKPTKKRNLNTDSNEEKPKKRGPAQKPLHPCFRRPDAEPPSPEKPVICPKCWFRFVCNEDLQIHKLHWSQAKMYVCRIFACTKSFDDRKSLESHQEEIHKGCVYKCEEVKCAKLKGFASQKGLEAHVRDKHSGTFKFSCEDCGQGFNHKGEFESHQLRHKDKLFACSKCKKPFYTTGELSAHVKICGKEDAFKCDICGKGFPIKSYLDNHLISHNTTDKKYQCSKCDKSYKYKAGLYKHYKVHK